MSQNAMFAVPPAELVQARTLSHSAVQWPSRAARANLEPAADDGHSNLRWRDDVHGFVSHHLDGERRYQLGFTFSSASLIWLIDGEVADALNLAEANESAAGAWCDARLSGAGLNSTGLAEMPYELAPVDYGGFADPGSARKLETLGAWYARAQTILENLVSEFQARAVSLPVIRCWPHHYDLATLFVLDEGDPETARSVGVGLSPGDESYAEPYYYCTPWPTPESLPAPISPVSWHTEGFISMVCPASRIDEKTDLDEVLATAVRLAHGTLR